MIPSDSIEWGYAMYGTSTKKMLNMLILDILKEYSDDDHRLLQQDIIDLLETNYSIFIEKVGALYDTGRKFDSKERLRKFSM